MCAPEMWQPSNDVLNSTGRKTKDKKKQITINLEQSNAIVEHVDFFFLSLQLHKVKQIMRAKNKNKKKKIERQKKKINQNQQNICSSFLFVYSLDMLS